MHHNSTAANVKLCQGKVGVQVDCHTLLGIGGITFSCRSCLRRPFSHPLESCELFRCLMISFVMGRMLTGSLFRPHYRCLVFLCTLEFSAGHLDHLSIFASL